MIKQNAIPVLHLRSVPNHHFNDLQDIIERELDAFLRPFLLQKSWQNSSKKVAEIVVGRGLNSSNKIQNQHPVLFYTQEYLKKLGFTWQEKPFNPGTLVIFID